MMSLNDALRDGMNTSDDVDVVKELLQTLVVGTKASNAFPSDDEDLEYYSSFAEFRNRMDDCKNRLTRIIEQLGVQVGGGSDTFDLASLREATDPANEQHFEGLAEILDLLYENVDMSLDQAKGVKNGHANATTNVTSSELARRVKSGMNGVVTHASNILRPQLKFAKKVDNSRDPVKGNDEQDDSLIAAHARSLGVDTEQTQRVVNPFAQEIRNAFEDPACADWLYAKPPKDDPVPMFPPLETFPLEWIDKLPDLERVCNELKKFDRIAVDLENHSYRSFQGFVCLMQVTTAEKDYLIDTLALREHMNILNGVFTDPNILKVLHGSDSDVVWLQRDFGIYVVSLFDTGQAARTLNVPAGLAYALRHYCNVHANKAYQLADWRLRPLTEEMRLYARQDTHYLLFIFENMRRELIAQSAEGAGETENLLHLTLKKSTEIALTTYERPPFTSQSYKRIIKRRNLRLSATQERVLAALYDWRDQTARDEDESEEYVLPQKLMIRLAQSVPVTVTDMENMCNPMPEVLRYQLTTVLQLIKSNSVLGPAAGATASSPAPKLNYAAALAASSTTPVRRPQPTGFKGAATTTPGSASIGVNSSRTSFVPITEDNLQTPKTTHGLGRRGSLQQEQSVRATPSPVLTTEQLYDTAGWQDLHDAGSGRRKWGGAASSGLSQQLLAKGGASRHFLDQGVDETGGTMSSKAMATHTKIGKEQLATFSDVLVETPFATMATAMAASEQQAKAEGDHHHASSSRSPKSANGGSAEKTHLGSGNRMDLESADQGKDLPEDLDLDEEEDAFADSPADTDALESDNIPKSMAEIYRISNRNRKRNKEKKKTKDEIDVEVADPAAQSLENTAYSVGRKRAKNGTGTQQGGARGAANNTTEDAVSFMRDIGWVKEGEVPTPQMYNKDGEILVGGEEDGDNASSNKLSSSGGWTSTGNQQDGKRNGLNRSAKRHGKPQSPRRRSGQQQYGGHRSHSSGRNNNRTNSNNLPPSGKVVAPSQAAFEYSQVAAMAAGVTGNNPAPRSQGSGRGGRRGGGGNAWGNSSGGKYSSRGHHNSKSSNK